MKKLLLFLLIIFLFNGCKINEPIEKSPEMIDIIFVNDYYCSYKNFFLQITYVTVENGIPVTSTLTISQKSTQPLWPVEKSDKNCIKSLAFYNNGQITFEQEVNYKIIDSCYIVINFDENKNSFVITSKSNS